ncbi:MAG: GTPase ObgE [Deltaproteobacteria bacterium]|jgi:GTP-binding protein|nr:GTPase ObgE [Deltaproteobacteria bacterium]
MKFVDEVAIYVRSGKGGDGCGSLARRKFEPKGGPDGGDGGHGGDVILEATHNLGTLLDFRYQQHYRAEHGEAGMGNGKYGRNGEDAIVKVPIGTLVADDATGEILGDLAEEGARLIVAKGGKRGRGNLHFVTSTNQAPRYYEKGGEAVEKKVRLTLKLLADVGLVGFPNVGKSTLISRISAAKPKIADYPFTTLVPNLGMVRIGPESGFVVADIPGLIAGASEGAGLGHRFLRHVERVAILAFLVSVSYEEDRNPLADYQTLKDELSRYDESMLEKPRVLILAKGDLPDTDDVEEEVRALAEAEGIKFFRISAVEGSGLGLLVHHLDQVVRERRKSQLEAPDDPPPSSVEQAPANEE